MYEQKVNDIVTIKNGSMTLTLVKGEEHQTYNMPFEKHETPLNSKGTKSMQDIQYLGAINTYCKRYLYLNAFGITDGEVIDAMDNEEVKSPKAPTKKAPMKEEPKAPTKEEQEIYERALFLVKGMIERVKTLEDVQEAWNSLNDIPQALTSLHDSKRIIYNKGVELGFVFNKKIGLFEKMEVTK
jgi:hypothetical protein